MRSYLLFFIFLLWFSGTPISNASGSWVTQTVDSSGDVGQYTSIAIDSNNKLHISYREVNHGLKYATNASGSWVTETVDSIGYAGWFTSIAVDSNNKVHISYLDFPTYLKYATNASDSWITETVDYAETVPEPSSEYTSIETDSNNKVHVSFYDKGYLRYATNISGSWLTQTVDAGGMGNSVAIDSSNKLHISYYDFAGDLKYATGYPSGPWDIQTVDSAVYMLLYFYSIVNTSVATDSNSKVHISYYDATNGDLKYATNASGSWITQTVDSGGNVGGCTSIAVDSNNNAHISYYDATNGDLKYATNASGSWVTQTIDSAGDVGIHTSITIANNKVHVSYYDATNGNLKHATNDVPVECSLIPDNVSVHRGGTLGIQMSATNNTDQSQSFLFATFVTTPSGNRYPASGWLFGPLSVTLSGNGSRSGHKTHYIPIGAPLGTYTYHGYTGNYGVGLYDECQFNFEVIEYHQNCTACHQ